jgi:serine/threonine protein kinase
VDEVCDQFEAAWCLGSTPRIEDFLGATPELGLHGLLGQLMATELELRSRYGERPDPAEYRARFPGLDELVAAVYAEFEVTTDLPNSPSTGGGRMGTLAAVTSARPVGQFLSIQGSSNDPFATVRELGDFLERVGAEPNQPAHALSKAPLDVPRGACLGNYEIIGPVGSGGMGAVYRARHALLKRDVALKLLSPNTLDDGTAVLRFQREAEAIGRLAHPNIVAAHDAGEADGVRFLVMELVEGVDLARLVKERGPLAAPDACEIIRQAAAGLQHAFRNRWVHRDIKPSNLILSDEGVVKLLDLGLALPRDERTRGELWLGTNKPGESRGNAYEGLTHDGQHVGTLRYMAPEQATDAHGVDIRADIYSLGCTLYFLLSGHAPARIARSPTEPDNTAASTGECNFAIRSLRPDMPAGLTHVLARMMADRPSERFSSPADAGAAVAPFARGHQLALIASSLSRLPSRDVVRDSPDPPDSDEVRSGLASVVRSARLGTKKRHTALRACTMVALFGLVAGLLLIRVHHRDGTEINIEVPGSASVLVEDRLKNVRPYGGNKAGPKFSPASDQSRKSPSSAKPIATNSGEQIELANQHTKRKEYEKALLIFNEIIRLDPKNSRAFFGRGDVFRLSGRYDPAIADYTVAIELESGRGEYYSARGDCWKNKNELKRAVTDYDCAIARQEVPWAAAFVERGKIHEGLRNYNKALADYRHATEIDQWCDEAFFQCARLSLIRADARQGDIHRAVVAAETACALENHENAGYLRLLAEAHHAAGNLWAAIDSQSKAVRRAIVTNDARAEDFRRAMRIYLAEKGRTHKDGSGPNPGRRTNDK